MKKLYLLLLVFPFALNAENIKLPTPVKNGGKPLMEALNARQSTRVFQKKSCRQTRCRTCFGLHLVIIAPIRERRLLL